MTNNFVAREHGHFVAAVLSRAQLCADVHILIVVKVSSSVVGRDLDLPMNMLKRGLKDPNDPRY